MEARSAKRQGKKASLLLQRLQFARVASCQRLLSPPAGSVRKLNLSPPLFTRPIPNYVHDKNINSPRVFHIDIRGSFLRVSLPRDASNNWLRWKPHSATNPFPLPSTYEACLILSPRSTCVHQASEEYSTFLPWPSFIIFSSRFSLSLSLSLSRSVAVLEDPSRSFPGPLSRPRGNSRGYFYVSPFMWSTITDCFSERVTRGAGGGGLPFRNTALYLSGQAA